MCIVQRCAMFAAAPRKLILLLWAGSVQNTHVSHKRQLGTQLTSMFSTWHVCAGHGIV